MTNEERVEARAVCVHFGGVKAVDEVDLLLNRREILGLIGPNGAGKTTLVNAVSGFQELTTGSVFVAGRDVTGFAPQRLARIGIARTFQSVRLFPNLCILDNVALGAVGLGRSQRDARRIAGDLLRELPLTLDVDAPAAGLPHGEERRVGILRALAMEPRFVLLDEPAAGLNELESDELSNWLREIPENLGCGLLVIEHDMRLIMGLCDRIQVLDYGRTIALGPAQQIRQDAAVLAAYLGADAGATA